MRISTELQTRLATLFRKAERAAAMERRAPIIVDIPLRGFGTGIERRAEAPLDPAKLVGRCMRVNPSGRVCGRPTAGDADECFPQCGGEAGGGDTEVAGERLAALATGCW